ncbi:hypothetical protein PTKIN_Ptkin10aG0162700 [Pterospermum kingtungense]
MAIQAQLYSDNIGFPVCGSHDWIDIGCGGVGGGGVGGGFNQFGFSLQQKPQLQQQQQPQLQQLQNLQLRNQNLCSDNSLVTYNNNHQSLMYCQRHELDQFIRSQNERLRLLLLEQRKQQIGVLSRKIESKVCFLLRQKDEEILKATHKTMELQNLLKKLEMENQEWQRVAQENEAMVMSLNNTLEQLQQASCCFNYGADDAESCCEVNRDTDAAGPVVGGGTAAGDHGREQEEDTTRKMTTMVCKCCNSRTTCVLFLPCRHLCSCKDCAAFLDTCPVCRTAKKASIEALVS